MLTLLQVYRNILKQNEFFKLPPQPHMDGFHSFFFFQFQFPVAILVFGYECVKLYKESKKRRMEGNTEAICEASIQWTGINLAFCALCGIIGGTVGGLLGSGGGFVLGPLLLEIGVIPQVLVAIIILA